MVANQTITVKLNLTGSPAIRFQGKPLGFYALHASEERSPP